MLVGVSQSDCIAAVVEAQPTRALCRRQSEYSIIKHRLRAGQPTAIHDHRAALGQNIALIKVAPQRYGVGEAPAGHVHIRLAKVCDLDELILDAEEVRFARRLTVQRVVMASRRIAGRVGQKLSDCHVLLCLAWNINIPSQRMHAFTVLCLK